MTSRARIRRRAAATSGIAMFLVLVTACGPESGPPEVIVDRTACDHCTMLVSDLRFGAAYHVPGDVPRVFDDVGCLLEDLNELGHGEEIELWVRDFHSERWLELATATLVRTDSVATPMAGGIIAFADEAAAERFLAGADGAVMDDLLQRDGRQASEGGR